MKLKKIVSLILLGAVSISAFSGCGSESDLTKSLKGEKVYLIKLFMIKKAGLRIILIVLKI